MKTWILPALGFVLASVPSSALASETVTYEYDAVGRLILVSRTGTINNNSQTKYEFDAAGNRSKLKTTNARPPVVVVPLDGFIVIPLGGF